MLREREPTVLRAAGAARDRRAARAQVRQFVTGVFQECGVQFETPTKQGISTAIRQCRANAESMMGDKGADIIRHHYVEMTKLVDRLRE